MKSLTRNVSRQILLAALVLACVPLAGSGQSFVDETTRQAAGSGRPDTVSELHDYYLPGRGENLLEEARRAVEEIRFRDAERLIDQALQVNRANSGLYDPSQLRILDELLGTLLLQQKWTEFDKRLDYVEWLLERSYVGNPEPHADRLLRQAEWHRAAAAAHQGPKSAWYLIRGKFMEWRAVSLIEERYGKQDKKLAPILYRIVLSHFYQTVAIERRGMTSFDFKTDRSEIVNGWMLSSSDTVRRSYRIGRELLQRIRSIYAAGPEPSAVTDALLQVHLADWEFLYGNNRAALARYREAHEALTRAGVAQQEVEAYFNQLKVLPVPELQIEWQSPVVPDQAAAHTVVGWSRVYPGAEAPTALLQPPFSLLSPQQPRVRARMALANAADQASSAAAFNYEVADLTVLGPVSDTEGVIDQAMRELPLLTFRPRLQGGELAARESILLNYQVTPD